ncbi:MAG: hypothetical protein Q8P22_10350 [Chloroflexota bacterium]|nr:hypothetical protein [Chloroflexota bacterium]
MTALYREQYDRMKRWYDRFVALDQGRPHDVPSDNYLDEIYAFFMNCYHLKDWIKHDGTVVPTAQRAVEPYINSSRPLKLCADICNSLKHLCLTSSRSGESPAFGKKHFGLAVGTAPTTINLKYKVNTTAGPIDAFQLATECRDAWDTFLTTNGLT